MIPLLAFLFGTGLVAVRPDGIRLVASITVEAMEELGLSEGSDVTAVVKASDVILATGD